jgi:phage repressor protein C with HTH and peptisase S24 domain
MMPLINNKDYLVINPHKEFVKGLAVVRHDFGEEPAYKIRMVRKKGGMYILTPMNPLYEELEIRPNKGTFFYVPVKVISMRDLTGGE